MVTGFWPEARSEKPEAKALILSATMRRFEWELVK
jgi:hypothetical protein